MRPYDSIQPLRSNLTRFTRKHFGLLFTLIGLFGSSGPTHAGAPPVNDNYANATLLAGEDALISGITADATLERGQDGSSETLGPENPGLLPCDSGYDFASMKSLWWRWRAPRAGVAFVLMNEFNDPTGLCSPLVRFWRSTALGAGFPFRPSAPPIGELSSGASGARYPYLPIQVLEGEELIFQMLGNSPFPCSARIILRSAPLILEEPVSFAAHEGESVLLKVIAVGARTPPVPQLTGLWGGCRYQWWFNDQPLAGETRSTLVFREMSVDRVGAYHVVIDDLSGTTRSRDATLSIIATNQPPHLGVRITPSTSQSEFSLVGELGRIYALESSTNLIHWTPAELLPQSGLEAETSFVTGLRRAIRNRIAYHGTPFTFTLTPTNRAAFIRAQLWESSCPNCLTELWGVQFGKEDWAREDRRKGTDAAGATDVFPRHLSTDLGFTWPPTNLICPRLELILSTVSASPIWPCPYWSTAEGKLVDTEELPGGIWNGARSR